MKEYTYDLFLNLVIPVLKLNLFKLMELMFGSIFGTYPAIQNFLKLEMNFTRMLKDAF